MQKKAPDWFVRELKSINSRLGVIWSPQYCKWIIVSPAPVSVFRKGYIVEMIVEDENHSFLPLDRRVLDSLKIAQYELDNTAWSIEKQLKEEERRAREKGERAAQERRRMQQDFFKKWHHFLTKKVFT